MGKRKLKAIGFWTHEAAGEGRYPSIEITLNRPLTALEAAGIFHVVQGALKDGK